MIRFTCKACGKRHRRSDEEAGTLVFCDCGQGNRVPWEAADEPDEAVPTAEEPQPRRARDAEETGAPQRPRRPRMAPADREEPRSRPGRRAAVVLPAPGHCLNHPDEAAGQTCADCGEAFCPGCVVIFQDQVLCGPCKNLRVRRRDRTMPMSALAIVALLLGVLGSPVLFCVTFSPLGMDASDEARAAWALAGVVLPVVTLFVSVLAVRQVERPPGARGRGMALTGLAFAVVGLLWSASLAALMFSRLWHD